MKLGILCGVVLGFVVIAVAIAAVTILAIAPLTREVSSQTLDPGNPGQNGPITSLVLPTPPPGTIPTPNPPRPANARVDFNLNVLDFTVNGFSADITAQVANTGTAEAHNLQAQIQAISAGSIVQVNNSNSFVLPLGALKAGQTTTVKTTLGFNLIDGLKIKSNGATVHLWLISDEKTQTFSYDYRP